jgi:hypothetical protein
MRLSRHTPIAFAFEGKATRGKSLSITMADWQKLTVQAHDLRPAMAYRFYRPDNTLTPLADLVMVKSDDFAEILELANIYSEMSDR